MNHDPAEFLRTVEIGARVVARIHAGAGWRDVLGYIRLREADGCTIETRRRGQVAIKYADVALAKRVPEPPVRSQRPRNDVASSDQIPAISDRLLAEQEAGEELA